MKLPWKPSMTPWAARPMTTSHMLRAWPTVAITTKAAMIRVSAISAWREPRRTPGAARTMRA
jgi:hypothetical protein